MGRSTGDPDSNVRKHRGRDEDDDEVEDVDWLARILDLIYVRYGWTEEHVEKIPYARFSQLVRVIAESRQVEWLDSWRKPAFLGWLGYCMQPMAKGSSKLTLEKWYNSFGLGDKRVISNKEVESTRKKAVGAVDKLRAALSRPKRKGGPP